jgi:hypothetical protein
VIRLNPFRRRESRRASGDPRAARRDDVVLIPGEPRGKSLRPGERGRPDARGQLWRFSKKRLFLAFLIACLSDVVGATFIWLPPVVWAVDFLTAVLLFIVLGWSWFLLPGLLMEAIPGLEIIPLWVLVVGAIAIFGSPRPRLK